jgi:hypothetical protein
MKKNHTSLTEAIRGKITPYVEGIKRVLGEYLEISDKDFKHIFDLINSLEGKSVNELIFRR